MRLCSLKRYRRVVGDETRLKELLTPQRSEWPYLLLLLVAIVPLFALNGRWEPGGNPDTQAVAVAAWHLAGEGTLDLTDVGTIAADREHLDRWYVYDKTGRIVSNRAPGLIALAVPAYWIAKSEPYATAPATAVALLATTIAVVVCWRVFCRLVDVVFATVAALVLALGTSTWAISASELWPHGPGQLWASIAVVSISVGSYFVTGWAYAASALTRPLTLVSAAVLGISEGWRTRSWTPVIRIGTVSMIGAVAFILYNRWLFGTWSLTGGYSSHFTTGAVERFDLGDYSSNLFQMFLGPDHGFLVVSPILGFALIGALLAWQSLPSWVKSLAWSGLGYLLIHAALNRASGGLAAFYRYPLEAIVLASPMFLLGAKDLWDRRSTFLRQLLVLAAVTSVLLQVVHIRINCVSTSPDLVSCFLPGG